MEISDKIIITQSLSSELDTKYSSTTNIALAAIITAEARMFMLPYRLDPRTAYTDTDSVIIDGKEPLNDMEVHPSKIGAFKLENYLKSFITFMKKGYCYKTLDDNEVVKIAGVPSNIVSYNQIVEMVKTGTTINTEFEKTLLSKSRMSLKKVKIDVKLSTDNNKSIMKVYNLDNQ
jgi:hypothetical protein